MTTKTKTTKPAAKTAKAAKPAAYTAKPADIKLATEAGEALRAGESARAMAGIKALALHKAGAVVGKKGECPLAVAFLNARYPGGKNAKGGKVSAGTQDVTLSLFRKAVKTGKGYDENEARTKAKGKKGAKGGSGVIMIAVKSGGSAEDMAKALRAGMNKAKAANDALAALAAYVLDAIDDAGFPGDDE